MKVVFAVMLALLGGLGVSNVGAQTRYHCRDGNGNDYSLSRPCPSGSTTRTVEAGPAPSSYSYSQPSRPTVVRTAPDVPDHYSYMSGRCRSLDENIRNAYSRKIAPDVVQGMQREYRRDCSEEERDASRRMYDERRSGDRQRRDEEQSAQAAADAARQQDARQVQQCAESQRILNVKRARTDLTEGERGDLKRFEEAFLARCKR
ncbi:hypothetical protein LJR118_000013 [Acidovorax sp. LjRoot118]|uniref:hypothetical protein n=1 Tax=Acidovorax sp. LjRoot118 TaxID=3342256 RepID=UPI003ECD1544